MFEAGSAPVRAKAARPGWWRAAALAAVVVLVGVLASSLDLVEVVDNLREWIESLGTWAPAVFVLLYGAWAVAGLPNSWLNLAGGAVFGALLGVASATLGAILGSTLAFVVGRYLAREAVAARLAQNRHYRRLNRLTDRCGWGVVALVRLIPLIPFNIQNYGLSLTSIKLSTYVMWSAISILPVTVLYVVGVEALLEGLRTEEVPWTLVAILSIKAVLAVVAVWFIRRRLRRVGRQNPDAPA